MISAHPSSRLPILFFTAYAALLLTGCGGAAGSATGPSGPSGPSTPSGQTIYVQSKTGILEFSTTQNGDVAPVATLVPSDSVVPSQIKLDPSGNIYGLGTITTNNGGLITQTAQLSVFAAGSKGTTTPTRTINGRYNNIPVGGPMVADKTGQIYVADPPSRAILIYEANATGDTPAAHAINNISEMNGRTINSLAMDSSSNLYVSLADGLYPREIVVFSAGVTGSSITPARILSGTSTQFESGGMRMAFDSAGNLYVKSYSAGSAAHIDVFAPGANGNVSPIRTITGTTSHPLGEGRMAFDSSDNLYIVAFPGSVPTIDKYAAGVSGSVDPVAEIHSSSSWSYAGIALNGPIAIF